MEPDTSPVDDSQVVELTDLPVEILRNITKRLTITKDILSFAATCTTAASAYRNTWQPTIHILRQRHWNNTAPVAPPTANPALVHSPQLLLNWRLQAEDNLRNCDPVREWGTVDPDLEGTFFVRINRQHQRVVAANLAPDFNDAELEIDYLVTECITIWDINGQKLHRMEMGTLGVHGAVDTACDVLTFVDKEARFAVVDLDTCEHVWRSDMTWLRGFKEPNDDEEFDNPYGSTQILNNNLFLTSHPSANDIALHDIRMHPHSPALRFTTPDALVAAYAMHEGNRTTPVPSANDISCIAAYCTPRYPLRDQAIVTYDVRMVGAAAAHLIDRCSALQDGVDKGLCSMDINGRFLLLNFFSNVLEPRTYSLQVWDLLRPLKHGPLASTTADHGGFIVKMTDDARNVVTGGGQLGIWALTPGAGEAAQGEQVALEFQGEYEPGNGIINDADIADTLLVCGGYCVLLYTSFGE